jgi:DNA polymerase-3 subunit gamma/tau
LSYIALYREWRPQRFADMVGQEHIRTTLQNAIRFERFAHAYLFSGPRGTGKTSTAKIFAKAINCEQGPNVEPCNVCNACKGITEGSIMDVVEIDAASNRGVDEIRDLRDQVKYAPTEVRYKVYIIDEVHMLTPEAFNALLKTLEEPPRHVVFILATTESHKLPATIVSRCQRFDFKRIQGKDMIARLKQIAAEKQVEVEEQAYWLIVRASDGGMRDALSIFDQVLSFGGQTITSELIVNLLGAIRTDVLRSLMRAIIQGETAAALREFSALIQAGKDPAQCIHDLLQLSRDLLMFKTIPDLPEIRERLEYDPAFRELGNEVTVEDASYLMEQLTSVQTDMKWHANPRLMAESAMIHLCQRQGDAKQDIWERIRQLEQKMEALLKQVDQLSVNPVSIPAKAPRSRLDVSASGPRKNVWSADQPQEQVNTFSSFKESPPHVPLQFQTLNPELFQRIQARWHDILEEVKRRKITAQAWLLDGEPVAVADQQLLAAFKNQIHRETVMKPINKTVIDEVLSQFAGEKLELTALSKTEWQKLQVQLQALSSGKDPHDHRNELVRGPSPAADSVPEQVHPDSERQQDSKWIERSIALFGSEHVRIVEEEEMES